MEKQITSLLLVNNPGNGLTLRIKELDDKVKWLLRNHRNMDNYLELEPFSKDGELCGYICGTLKALPEVPTIAEYKDYNLREQFAGLMKQFFIEEQRSKEINLIKDINATAVTLKELVDYIQKSYENKEDGLKEIIKTFHPIIGELKDMLNISFKFYIEEFKDLKHLLESRGFVLKDKHIEKGGEYIFIRKSGIISYKLHINKLIFDENMRLKIFYPNEWDSSFLILNEETDELPF